MGFYQGVQKDLANCKVECALQKWVSPMTKTADEDTTERAVWNCQFHIKIQNEAGTRHILNFHIWFWSWIQGVDWM